jgi:site-specific recombinase XerD
MQLTAIRDVDLVDEYLHWVGVLRRRSPRTVRCYANVLKLFLQWLDDERGHRRLIEVEHDDIESFGARLGRKKIPEGQVSAAATARKDVVIVRYFYTWLSERHHEAGFRPMRTVAVPKVPESEPKPVDDAHWRILWQAAVDDDVLWLGLGYFMGLRRSEIVTVEPTAVKVDEKVLRFVRKGNKTKPIEYTAMLNAIDQELPQLTLGRANEFLDLLHTTAQERAALGANFLWWDSQGHMENDGNRLNKRLDKRLLPQLCLPPGSITPHRLRHSCATNLARVHMPAEYIQRQLSHSSIDITQRYMELGGEMARWWAKEKGRQI